MKEHLIGIIGGSGLGDALFEHIEDVRHEKTDTPFGEPSDDIVLGRLGNRDVAFINRHGRGHRYGPGQVPYRANIFALKKVGVTSIIASCAVGSLRENIAPTELVAVNQFIDKTTARESSFFDSLGAVHVEFAHPCCEYLRQAILKCSDVSQVRVHDGGVYVCMEGPAFSTRAESLMHRAWGGDLIGMTAMPEAKLAREAQISYALVGLVSDYDSWREHSGDANKFDLLNEIIGNLKKATENAITLIKAVLQSDEQLSCDDWPSRKSLQLGLWSGEDVIDRKVRKSLDVLFE